MREIMRGRKKAGDEKPPARLEDRPGDLDIPPTLFLECGLFRSLAKYPNPDKLPGILRLRRFKRGEAICREGDPGWTAFFILSADDVDALSPAGLEAEIARRKAAPKPDAKKIAKLEELRTQAAGLFAGEPAAPAHTDEVATVYGRPRRDDAPQPGFLSRLLGLAKAAPALPGLTEYGLRKARLRPGQVFGDWSCIYGTPRAATIVADRDLLVVEMLRNALDVILSDDKYQKKAHKEYVARTLERHLGELPVFSSLRPEELERLRAEAVSDQSPPERKIEFLQLRSDQVVFDKGDEPDGLYIVQRGLVKVLASVWPLLTPDDLLDEAKARAYLAAAPDDRLRAFLAGRIQPEAGLREAINVALADKSLTGAVARPPRRELRPELAPLLENRSFVAAWETRFPAKSEEWSDSDWRAFNRLVLETAWPGALRQNRQGAEHVLNYVPKGALFGEVGIMMRRPRAATCVAYVHPRPRSEDESAADVEAWRSEQRVELVRLPRPLVEKLCQDHPAIDAMLRGSAAAVARSDGGRKDAAERAVRQSPEFQRQGLIQGRKLMLVDLDRCTRCDECVRACVSTHKDGRTRLFLDGDRFGKYLVPTTCRLCRDPVCLIGCPVGSIVQGPAHEIVIKDWCIGCQLCAKSCPYGSIQMHDRGLVPEQSADWRFLPAEKLAGDAWTRPGFNDRRWPQGMAPFTWQELEPSARIAGATGDAPAMAFRLTFRLGQGVLAETENGLKLTVATDAAERRVEGTGKAAKVLGFPGVWINGKAVPTTEWRKHSEPGRDLNTFLWEVPPEKRGEWFVPGGNLIAVRATPTGGTLLGLALDESKPTGVIAERAVVCDQCGSGPERIPACVHACPHDAAMRVDAWSDEFPVK